MTDFPQAVREEAARRANATAQSDDYTAANIIALESHRALCQAVQDGALHLDLVELDRARWYEANRAADALSSVLSEYRRLVREGWTPPEPVDPVVEVAREVAGQYKSHPDPRIEAEAIATFAIRAWIERNGQ